jgi:hypothetical protein
MNKFGFIALLLSLVTCTAAAQPSTPSAAKGAKLPSAATPKIAVPQVDYQSVFTDKPGQPAKPANAATAADTKNAAQNWSNANRDVGQFKRGHVDILKWEETHNHSAPKAAPGSRP